MKIGTKIARLIEVIVEINDPNYEGRNEEYYSKLKEEKENLIKELDEYGRVISSCERL